ncbi:hypothetical protein EB796_018134 [Bugula neritina]|uniref:N-acetyltransferase domain-containing protein n=1 Tax=Bugula neritina TaxID=10212 RepID=A0A7J7JC02_BUGNE|nr:hypothetical protein EB796_018134 [Bugula neritina]
MESIEIQVWPFSEKTSRWKELVDIWYHFWQYEPINSAILNILEGDNREFIGYVFRDMLSYDSTPCVVAWDTVKNKAVGFVFSMVQYTPETLPADLKGKELLDFGKYPFKPDVLQKLGDIGNFLDKVFTESNLFTHLSVDKVFMIHVTSVLQEYTRRGLANEMTKKVLEVAREAGFEYAVSESTSSYTQHNKIKRFGFEKIFEIDFENNYANYDSMPAFIRESHKAVAVLTKRL